MTFGRVLVGWVVVLAWFLGWREATRRMRGIPGAAGPALRADLPALAIEAGLLTCFATLWFASLGSGGAWLLFPIVGLLMELPSRLRSHPVGGLPWKAVAGGVARILAAGLLLQVVMT